MIEWIDSITKYKDIIEKSDTIEDYMSAKKQVMLNAADIPCGVQTCVYCLMNTYIDDTGRFVLDCINCNYKNEYGLCSKEGSTWAKIYRAKRNFLDELQKY